MSQAVYVPQKHHVLLEGQLIVGYSQYYKTFDMPENHTHESFELYYLMSGKRNYFMNGRLYAIEKGDLVFVPKYELHRTLDAGTPQHDRFLVQFTDDLFDEVFGGQYKEVLLRPYYTGVRTLRLKPEDLLVLDGIVLRIIRDLKEQPTAHSLQVKLLITELLLFISRCLERYDAEISPVETPLQQKIAEIADFISKHYMNPLTLGQLSETFYLSPHYISRIFKQTTGFSFVKYLTFVRIGEAKRLLRETNMKVLHIADRVGFENLSHFNRVFKETVLLSPSQYRRMSGQK